MIKLQAIGHLGKDATINNVNGKTVINFNVAHTEKYRDVNNVEVQKTVWVGCAYWTDKTKVAQYLLKGSQVFVDGSPDVKMYKNNQGEVKANIILRVHSIQLLGGAKPGDGNQQPQGNQASSYDNGANSYQPVTTDITLTGDDDLPF
jgi:single-strand DNA-binding protein